LSRHRAHVVVHPAPRCVERRRRGVKQHQMSPRSRSAFPSCAGFVESTRPRDLRHHRAAARVWAPGGSAAARGGNGTRRQRRRRACLSRHVWLGFRPYDAHHGGVTRVRDPESAQPTATMVSVTTSTASSAWRRPTPITRVPARMIRSSATVNPRESAWWTAYYVIRRRCALRAMRSRSAPAACSPCASAPYVADGPYPDVFAARRGVVSRRSVGGRLLRPPPLMA